MEKKRMIPWDSILGAFKDEISVTQQEKLDKWLLEEQNRLLYNDLHLVWLSILQENLEHSSNVDELWGKMEKRMKRRSFFIQPFYRSRLGIVAVVSAILIFCFSTFAFYYIGDYVEKESALYTYTSLNGKSKVFLPDGSLVWLNAQSSLSYSFDKKEDRRQVILEGEACFEVAKDKKKPFIVTCGETEIEVFGTVFNVNSINGVEVSLLSGSVSVRSGDQFKHLSPGEVAICNTISKEINIEKRDVNFDVLWAQESINFERKSIRELSSSLSKWYGVTILLDPKIPDDQAYTFKITVEPLEEILRLMARTNPIEYSFDENNVLRIKRKNN
ncbi:MAG: FecR family protein [Massilibacteroides sp.]|nr:FecR family protein [Massilibacteroides sp.]MDD4660149.1 FecR family protein [Massilibacteroides sp.]